jgi:hypothetical protein
MRNTMTQPALIGGLVMGVLSALPIISAGNVCCCLWVLSGGIVAAYVLQQNQPQPITIGDGALAGLLASLVGSLVYLALSIPIMMIVAPMQRQLLESMMNGAGNIPPEFRSFATSYVGGALGIVLSFVTMLIAGLIFCTLGGVIGAAIFRRPPPPEPIPNLGPPPPM